VKATRLLVILGCFMLNALSEIRTGGRAFMVVGKVSKKEHCRHAVCFSPFGMK
jgi:hypothetical protein